MDTTMEPLGRGIAAGDADQRIRQVELAIQRTEEMVAENIALRSRIRSVVNAADRLAGGHVAPQIIAEQLPCAGRPLGFNR